MEKRYEKVGKEKGAASVLPFGFIRHPGISAPFRRPLPPSACEFTEGNIRFGIVCAPKVAAPKEEGIVEPATRAWSRRPRRAGAGKGT